MRAGDAYAWAAEAATVAGQVPAEGAEAALWTVRGWAEVALGCTVVGVPDAIHGLDDVICAAGIRHGGHFAARLRRLRRRWGPPPRGYPDQRHPAVKGSVDPVTWRACQLIGQFCDALSVTMAPADSARRRHAGYASATGELRWGERWRPSPTRDYRIVRCDLDPALVWRTWMRLPTSSGTSAIALDVRRQALIYAGHVQRGIHDGAHLDHMAATATTPASAPSSVEFGPGLLVAEAYAMAVEIIAAAESALIGEFTTTRTLRAGLVERIGRLPGYRLWAAQYGDGSPALKEGRATQAIEFADLPTLAQTYVLGPLRVLSTRHTGPYLPIKLSAALARRWSTACESYPPAAVLTAQAGELL